MRYHGLKMAEINKIIKEYWINTYKGNGKVTCSRFVYHYEVTHIIRGICFYHGAKFSDLPCRQIDQHKRLLCIFIVVIFIFLQT